MNDNNDWLFSSLSSINEIQQLSEMIYIHHNNIHSLLLLESIYAIATGIPSYGTINIPQLAK